MAMVTNNAQNKYHPYGGASRRLINSIFDGYAGELSKLDKRKIRFIKNMSGLSLGMPALERLFYNKKIQKQEIQSGPIFVIGHWRSGTTFLHHLLTRDPQFGFLNNLQAFCPDYFLQQTSIVKSIFNKYLPKNRPVDLVKLGADLPQEDEFALANMISTSCYHGLYFPTQAAYFFENFLQLDGLDNDQYQAWTTRYTRLLKKLTYFWSGKTLVLKNPPHTARIRLLKNLFPQAKFIYLLRHPQEVFKSSEKFFSGLLPQLSLEKQLNTDLETRIKSNYLQLLKTVIHDFDTLSSNEFMAIHYDDLISNPQEVLQSIYSTLKIKDFDAHNFTDYLEHQKSHQVQTHEFNEKLDAWIGNDGYEIYQAHLKLCKRIKK